jgi:O-antigen/teichoic acid export membrane protein
MENFWNKLKDIASIGVADIAAAGISSIFWFYIASTVGPEDYGQITYFISIAMLSSTIALFGASNTNIVYTAKKIPIQSTLYLITLTSGIIISIILFVIFINIGVSSLILGFIIFSLATSEILGKKLFKIYSKFILTQKILMIILGISAYYFVGIEGILIGYGLSYIPYTYIIFNSFRTEKIDFSLIKQKLHFIIPQYFQTLSGSLSGSLDKLIIAPLFGFTLLGNYSLGLQVYALLTLLPAVVVKYIIPQDSSGIENKKLKLIIILSSIIIAILGFTFGPIVISTIFPKFTNAEEVIQIISFATIPYTITNVYHSKFYGLEKSKYVLISSTLSTGTQILGILILGSLFGVNGIAASLVLGSSAATIFVVLADKNIKKNN